MVKDFFLFRKTFYEFKNVHRGLDLMPYMGWLFHMDPRAEQLSQALEGADVLNRNRRKKRFDNFERNKCQPMITCLDYKK